MKKLIYLFGILVFSASPIYAQEAASAAASFDLQDAVQYALSNNPSIKKSQLDEKSAEYKVKEIQGSGLPQLNASGQLNSFPSLPTQLLPGELAGQPGTLIPVQFGTKYSATGAVELQQLLFSKSFFVGLEAANTTRDLYRLRVQMSEEEVIYNVSSSFLQLLQTKQQFNTVDANLARLEQLEEILKLQYGNDIITKVQVNRVVVNKTNLQNQRQNLASIYQQQLNGLKFFMNMPMDQPLEVEANTLILDLAMSPEGDANYVEADRIDFKLLNAQKELYNLNVRNISGGYYPSLSAFAQANTNAQRNEFNFTDMDNPWFKAVSLGVRLNIPIFDGFQRRNQIRQANIEVSKVEEDLQQLRQSTNMQINNANTQMEVSLSSIKAQEQNVVLAQEVYDNTNETYKEGLSPLTDLLDAELSLREAEFNLNNERLKYQLAQLTLLQAKGDLRLLKQ